MRRETDARRGTTAERGYGSKWRSAREGYLRAHPLCVSCAEIGKVVAATVVDHIDPHRGDYAKMWSSSNWQPLCTACHNRKTARQDGGFGR